MIKNSYFKIVEYNSEYITGLVVGSINKDQIVELYDSLNNPLGIYSHIEEIKIYGIEFDSISNGQTALFKCPGFDISLLDNGMKIVVSEE